jgi:hypothetical protein
VILAERLDNNSFGRFPVGDELRKPIAAGNHEHANESGPRAA